MQRHGLGDRLGARVRPTHEPELLPLDAVALPAVLRGRASPTARRRRSTGARTTRPCSRTSRSSTAAASAAAPRSRRATSSSGSSRSPTTPTRCSTSMRLLELARAAMTMQRNWIGRSRGRRVRVPGRRARRGHCPSSRPGRTRSSARRSSCWRPSTRSSSSSCRTEHEAEVRGVRHAHARRARPRSARRRRRRRRLHRPLRRRTRSTASAIPIWVADYVLMDYGTGAIMAVPPTTSATSSSRSATACRRHVVAPADGDVDEGAFVAHTEDERARQLGRVHRPAGSERASRRSSSGWPSSGRGGPTVELPPARLAASRASATGAPRSRSSTASDCGDRARARRRAAGAPAGRRGLPAEGAARRSLAAEDWVHVACPSCGGPARRETDTMDTFVDSSWYFLRYCDPHNDQAPFDARARRLLAAGRPVHRRHRARDPAPALRALLHEGAERPRPGRVPRAVRSACSTRGWVTLDGAKMSKSKGNVVGPDELVDAYGADAVRLYILFMGPADQDMEWQDHGRRGHRARFLQPAVADRARAGRRSRAARRARRRRWRARRTRRSRRSPTTSAAASPSTRRSRR